MPNELPEWVVIFERIGPGSTLFIFILAVLWKLLPALVRLLVAWKKQSDTITLAVPSIKHTFETLVKNVSIGFDRIEKKIGAKGGEISEDPHSH